MDTFAAAKRQFRLQLRPDEVQQESEAVEAFVRDAVAQHGHYWNKAACEPGAEKELARSALQRLAALKLVQDGAASVRALPALARFSLGHTEVTTRKRSAGATPDARLQFDLF